MKKMTLILLMATLMIFARRSKEPEVPVMASATDSFSYAIGMAIAKDLDKLSDNINAVFLLQGLKDKLTDSTLLLTPEQAKAVQDSMFTKIQERLTAERDSIALANLVAGEAFLAENAKKEGITTTPSGLQYEIITQGDGPRPTAESQVSVHYVGTTIEGKVFDSSRERNEPAHFGLNQVIPGWSELVLLMNTGTIIKGYLPSELAYGERGAGEDIAGNSTLIFEVELLEVLTNPAVDPAKAEVVESDSTNTEEVPVTK